MASAKDKDKGIVELKNNPKHIEIAPSITEAEYRANLIRNRGEETARRLVVGTATRGTVRMEWVLARYGQIIPCNWSMTQVMQYIDSTVPLGFLVADAQNVIVKTAVEGDYEWLLLVEDDTLPPADAFVRLNEYIRSREVPVVSGLYYTKSIPPEPLLYRGIGTSFYNDWKMGDRVWVDGVPTGFLLIHCSILRVLWNESPEYNCGGVITRRVFDQPEEVYFDAESQSLVTMTGTSDLQFCQRIIKNDVLRRAGWDEIANKEYPFLVDTNIFCRHIDPSGIVYPPNGIIPNVK